MTNLWHPIEGRTDIWDRCFRVEIDYPLGGDPTVYGHLQRSIQVGQEVIQQSRPSLQVKASEIAADAELAACMAMPLEAGLTSMLQILWTRSLGLPAAPETPADPGEANAIG